VRGHSVSQERRERVLVLTACGPDGEEAGHEHGASRTVRPKAAFAPQHRQTERPLNGVVGGLDTGDGG